MNSKEIFRRHILPERVEAEEQLEAARQEWEAMKAANPVLVMEVQRRLEEARQQP